MSVSWIVGLNPVCVWGQVAVSHGTKQCLPQLEKAWDPVFREDSV
jgi:hypothetical protein